MKEDYNEKLLSQFLEKEIQEKGYVDESTIKFAQNRRRHAQINEKYVNDGIKITEEKEQPLASSESDQDYQVQIIEDIDVETDSVPDVPQDDPPSVNKHYEALSSSDEDVPSKESSIKVNDDEVVPDQMPEPQIIVQKPKREKKVSLDKPIMPQIVQDIPRPFQEAPIVLAQAQSDGKIQLNAPALELIKSFSSSLKLVTIIGPRMTGKHLLTNNLAKCPEGSKGFDQENQAGKPRNVQEIRTWGRPTEIGGKSVFFLKWEVNLDVKSKGARRMIGLCMLISTIVIYNTKGYIDEKAIGALKHVVDLQKSYNLEIGNAEQLSAVMPRFLWILRDFEAKGLNPQKYCEEILHSDPKKSKQPEIFEKVKHGMRDYFGNRECYSLPYPVADEVELYEFGDSPLKSNFLTAVEHLRAAIERTPVKTIKTIQLTGVLIVNLIEKFVTGINQATTVKFDYVHIWPDLVEEEHNNLYDLAVKHFKNICKQIKDVIPQDDNDLIINLEKGKSSAIAVLQSSQIKNEKKSKQNLTQLVDFIDREMDQVKEENYQASLDYNQKIITELFADLVEDLKDKDFDKDAVHADVAEASGIYVERAIGSSKNLVYVEYMKAFGEEFIPTYMKMFAESKQANEASRKVAVQMKELNWLKKQTEEEKGKGLVAPEDAGKDEDMKDQMDEIRLEMDINQDEKRKLQQELEEIEQKVKCHAAEVEPDEPREPHSRPEKKGGCKCILF